MAKKPRNVDLGPIYLQVGEETGALESIKPAQAAASADVSRFEALMHRERGQRQAEQLSPESLLGAALRGTPGEQLAHPDEISSELTHLWVGTGLQSEREIRAGLRDALLPGTAVRLHEHEGLLRIEFTCEAVGVTQWLVRHLPALSNTLCGRLARPLEITVFTAAGQMAGRFDTRSHGSWA